jgi:hypothetical protein
MGPSLLTSLLLRKLSDTFGYIGNRGTDEFQVCTALILQLERELAGCFRGFPLDVAKRGLDRGQRRV